MEQPICLHLVKTQDLNYDVRVGEIPLYANITFLKYRYFLLFSREGITLRHSMDHGMGERGQRKNCRMEIRLATAIGDDVEVERGKRDDDERKMRPN